MRDDLERELELDVISNAREGNLHRSIVLYTRSEHDIFDTIRLIQLTHRSSVSVVNVGGAFTVKHDLKVTSCLHWPRLFFSSGDSRSGTHSLSILST